MLGLGRKLLDFNLGGMWGIQQASFGLCAVAKRISAFTVSSVLRDPQSFFSKIVGNRKAYAHFASVSIAIGLHQP